MWIICLLDGDQLIQMCASPRVTAKQRVNLKLLCVGAEGLAELLAERVAPTMRFQGLFPESVVSIKFHGIVGFGVYATFTRIAELSGERNQLHEDTQRTRHCLREMSLLLSSQTGLRLSCPLRRVDSARAVGSLQPFSVGHLAALTIVILNDEWSPLRKDRQVAMLTVLVGEADADDCFDYFIHGRISFLRKPVETDGMLLALVVESEETMMMQSPRETGR